MLVLPRFSGYQRCRPADPCSVVHGARSWQGCASLFQLGIRSVSHCALFLRAKALQLPTGVSGLIGIKTCSIPCVTLYSWCMCAIGTGGPVGRNQGESEENAHGTPVRCRAAASNARAEVCTRTPLSWRRCAHWRRTVTDPSHRRQICACMPPLTTLGAVPSAIWSKLPQLGPLEWRRQDPTGENFYTYAAQKRMPSALRDRAGTQLYAR